MPASSPKLDGAASGAERRRDLPKKIGRYDVVRTLGAGAMGRVLLAHDPVLDRDVAVKLLRDDLQIPPDVREGLVVRMRHEARAAARVSHPNLVTLHDMGEDDELGLYLVFEYVSGPTLKQRLAEGHLTAKQAARLARELGGALTYAHEAGIVHRDVKPENVMLSPTGGKMADFGIARIPDSTLTHAGGLLGTPAYSAPETFRAGKFSPESDQFSLAATLYEAVYGRRAFPGDDAVTVAAKIANEVPERLAARAGLSPEVDAVFARALAKVPEERFPSCDAFGRALFGALTREHEPVRLAPARDAGAEAMQPLADTRPERKTGHVVLGAAVVAFTIALLVRTAVRSAESPPRDPLLDALDAGAATAAPTSRPRAPLATPRVHARPIEPRPVEPRDRTEPAASTAAPAPADAGPAAPSSASPAASAAPGPEAPAPSDTPSEPPATASQERDGGP